MDEQRSHDLVGRVLAGRYDVVRLLGRGGMGEVYEGNHRLLSKRVAIKVLAAPLAADDRLRHRFLREARAANLIEHDNVVQILDFGNDDPTYFVMEFLDGEDLHAAVSREHGLSWARARGIIEQIAAALGAAHARGIVHRDVKPSNCFLLRRGENPDFVKVLDFGIAKQIEASLATSAFTRTDELLGTAAYMAPEQAMAAAVDARTDVYALGILVYEMLTGNVPFVGSNSYHVLDQHVRATPPPPRFVDPATPPEIGAVILRALEKDPARRFQSMRELVDAVRRIGTGAVAAAPARTAFLAQNAELAPRLAPTEHFVRAAAHPQPPGPTEPLSIGATGVGTPSAAPSSPPPVSVGPRPWPAETAPRFTGLSTPPPTAMIVAEQRRSRTLRFIALGLGVVLALGGGIVVGTQITGGDARAPSETAQRELEPKPAVVGARVTPEIPASPIVHEGDDAAIAAQPQLAEVEPPKPSETKIDEVPKAAVPETQAAPAPAPLPTTADAEPTLPTALTAPDTPKKPTGPMTSRPKAKGTRLKLEVAAGLTKASVYIDGKRQGSTPKTLEVADGAHTVRFVWPSGASFEQRVHLVKNQALLVKGYQ